MILDLRRRVSTIETTYLTSPFLRNPIYELPRLQNNTLWVVTSEELIIFLSNSNAALDNIQAGIDTIATTNEINEWISPLHRTDVLDGHDYIISQNQITDWIDKGYSSAVIEGTDYITTDAYVSSNYATSETVTSLQTEVTANTTALTILQEK